MKSTLDAFIDFLRLCLYSCSTATKIMEVEVFKWSSFLHFGPFSSMYYFVCCHDHKSCHFLKCCIIDAKICCLWFQTCFLLIDTLLNRSSIYFYLILDTLEFYVVTFKPFTFSFRVTKTIWPKYEKTMLLVHTWCIITTGWPKLWLCVKKPFICDILLVKPKYVEGKYIQLVLIFSCLDLFIATTFLALLYRGLNCLVLLKDSIGHPVVVTAEAYNSSSLPKGNGSRWEVWMKAPKGAAIIICLIIHRTIHVVTIVHVHVVMLHSGGCYLENKHQHRRRYGNSLTSQIFQYWYYDSCYNISICF